MLSIIIGITLTLFRVRALTVIGFASWTQNAFTQSDADQDMLMVEACTNRYNVEPIGAATHSELLEMEIDNTSGGELLGICGDSTACKGRVYSGVVDGHSRNCWHNGKQTVPEQVYDDCRTSSRTTLCVVRNPTSMPTSQTEMPTPTPTQMPTLIQTFLPTANLTKETESCPETIGRLETVIDYLLDYVFCLKHEKDTDNCNGSHYMNHN